MASARAGVDALPRQAQLQYHIAVIVVAGLTIAWLTRFMPTSPAFIAVISLYTFTSLRAEHEYHVEAKRRGCAPAPHYPRDFLGIRYLLETMRAAKKNSLLEHRNEALEKLGRTYFYDVIGERCRSISTDEPENIRAILCTRFDDWIIPTLRTRSFLPVLGKHSIFTTNGPEWQHSRAVLRPAFVRDQISDLACLDRHIKKLVARIPKDDTPFDLQNMFSMMTTDSISDFMLGQTTDLQGSAPPDSYKFGRYFDASMHKIALRARFSWLSMLPADSELTEYSTFMKEFVKRFVKDVRNRVGEKADREESKYVFLDELLKSGESDEVICDHLLSIFTAGRDTTTSVLSYMFYQLSQRPDVVEIIRREIAELGDENPTWEQLRNMKYLNWVLKESLRLNPPVAVNSREALRDTVLPRGGGIDGKSPLFVRAGTIVRYTSWTMHRRKDLFGEDAEEFRPERWENLRVTLEYLPFNAGPRICIGQQFALTQMALITVRLLQAFKALQRRDDRPPIKNLGINLNLLHGCVISVTPA
ncbi:cytochrome P450 52E2 [Xylaria nigripes]|nr:cytochrome P450 52E2 [Xylaria nigripes]